MRPSFLQSCQPSRLLTESKWLPTPLSRHYASTSATSIAHSIRAAVESGQIHQGYRIFTRAHAKDSNTSKHRGPQFNTSRLLAHVLLHALLRSPNPSLASTFAKGCLNNGIRIRSSTLNIIFPTPFQTLKAGIVANGAVPQMSPSVHSALSLFNAARRSGHNNSKWMYDRFINSLLLHGEVLTAALLFAAIVKEWNASRQMKPIVRQAAAEDKKVHTDTTANHESFSPQSMLRRQDSSPLAAEWMRNIVHKIEEGSRVTNGRDLQSIQALGILVNLLEGDQPFIPARWRLLQVMYSLPPELHPNKAEYERWHQLLLNLCSSAKSQRLDTQSYHVLLQYALRERMSVELAASVVKALCRDQKPTATTYNILLRELGRLKDRPASEAVSRIINPLRQSPLTFPSTYPMHTSMHSLPHEAIVHELLKHPIPLPDEYTSTAAMSSAISSGNPQAACKHVAELFPTLEWPKRGPRRSIGGRYVTSRARSMSPHFWGTAVHAVAQAGNIRLSMRIWHLLMRAEMPLGHSLTLYSTEAYTSHFELFYKNIWRIYKQTRDVSGNIHSLESRRRVWGHFMNYNHLLLLIQRVLKSLRDRLANKEATFEVDQHLVKIVFSLVRYISVVEQYLPHLAYSVATMRQRRHHFEELPSRRRVEDLIAMVRRMFAGYGALAPRQLRSWGWVKSVEEPLSALRVPKRSIPYSMRKSSIVRRTRFGFKVVYSGRTHRFEDDTRSLKEATLRTSATQSDLASLDQAL